MKSVKQYFSTKPLIALSLTVVCSVATAVEIHARDQADLVNKLVRLSDTQQLQTMMSQGMDINSQFIGDGTPLIMAVYQGNRDVAEELVAMGADVNLSSRGDGNSLIAAARKNRIELAQFLLQEGAELDAIVPGDETALITASRKGHIEMVRLLVEKGADVNLGMTVDTVSGSEYRSPLSMARTTEIEQYLRAAGATE